MRACVCVRAWIPFVSLINPGNPGCKPKINYSKIESVITKYSDEITELGYSNPNKIINDLKERKTINLSNFTLKLEDYSIDSIDSRGCP